jgi:hypothetical protein
MKSVDFDDICDYSRNFSRLDEAKIATLHRIRNEITPRIPEVTEVFYAHLQTIPKARPFLDGKVEQLKRVHQQWVEELFASNFDEAYTRKLYMVGSVHVKVKLPIEFMAGAMLVIQSELMRIFNELYGDEPDMLVKLNDSIHSAIGFSLLVMQESYQASSLIDELEKFLKITGMSRTLFNNLALAYR